MDITKLMDKLLSYEEIKGIPYIYVYKVLSYVIEAISSGECFYEEE